MHMTLVYHFESFLLIITITSPSCPYNVYPFIPHFYIVKLGYTRVYIFFLFLIQNIDSGYFLMKFSILTALKLSVYLHGYVFVMVSCMITKISQCTTTLNHF